MSFIYKITNLINGKIYIGQTSKENPEDRFKQHLKIASCPNDYRNCYSYLHKAINKYGANNFKFEIIDSAQEDKINDLEIYYISFYDSFNSENGYNLTNGGDGIKGYIYSDEQLKAMSDRMKGKFDGDKNPFYGKKHSEETSKKLSECRIDYYKNNRHKFIGENHSHSKLTNEIVENILVKYYSELKSAAEISKELLLTRGVVEGVINGRVWAHIRTDIVRSPRDFNYCINYRFDKKLGSKIDYNLVCKNCGKEFVITQRENSKKSLPKYCCHECLYGRYKKNVNEEI